MATSLRLAHPNVLVCALSESRLSEQGTNHENGYTFNGIGLPAEKSVAWLLLSGTQFHPSVWILQLIYLKN